MKAIAIKDLSFAYRKENVIKSCNLEVESGELVLIIGGNGSGKSTLVKLMLGELEPDKGSIKILGKDIAKYKSYKKIGYVPQVNVVNKIAFPITCMELVALNLYEDFGFIKIPKKVHYDKARDILIKMGMEEFINTPVNELSGGLAQRAMIAKAMINMPELLILDEPTAGVDKENKEMFFKTLKKLQEDLGITIVMITHELKEMEDIQMTKTQYRMNEGRLSLC
ncbi:metal ABC transporter ATP-binding protein [Anaerococcus sp.]|uniref:metal ABC transporter ATP-binding protein n=1 Tax=Anaerococcus sp. TaxID=1872515 RepID=UPI0027BAB2D5|nr:ATP-binding cassette domain-containing protein [Anaerococcus sp.]